VKDDILSRDMQYEAKLGTISNSLEHNRFVVLQCGFLPFKPADDVACTSVVALFVEFDLNFNCKEQWQKSEIYVDRCIETNP
jgi:hypothetical protein